MKQKQLPKEFFMLALMLVLRVIYKSNFNFRESCSTFTEGDIFSNEKKKCHYRPVASHIGIKIHAAFP